MHLLNNLLNFLWNWKLEHQIYQELVSTNDITVKYEKITQRTYVSDKPADGVIPIQKSSYCIFPPATTRWKKKKNYYTRRLRTLCEIYPPTFLSSPSPIPSSAIFPSTALQKIGAINSLIL